MPIDPVKRAGKGAFSEETPSVEIDQDMIENVIKKAQTRTVLFDYLQMIFVGFMATIKGFFQFDGKTNERNEENLEK